MLMYDSLTGRAKLGLSLKFPTLRNAKMAAIPREKKKKKGSPTFSVPEDTEETGIAYGIMNL